MRTLLCCMLLLASSAQAGIGWGECDPELPATASPQCARFEVPLNPDQPEGESIQLHIMRYAARYQADQGEPVFLLAGGPGQGGSDSFPRMIRQLDSLREHHALIVIDQRGTGRSTKPECEAEQMQALVPPDRENLRAQIRHCLETVDLDPRLFTTREAVLDMDAVRQALVVDKISLYGVSYGTRLATGYMRLFSKHLQRVILDGVVPVDEPLGAHHAVNLQRTLNLMTEVCATDAHCNRQWPDLKPHMMALPAQADRQGGQLRLRHPRSAEWVELPLSRVLPQVMLRMYAYQGNQLSLLPWMVEQAHAGDWKPLAAQGLMLTEQLGEHMAMIMHNSIVCTEDWPFIKDTAVDNSDTLLGDSLIQQLEDLCAEWPTGTRIEQVREPLQVSVPTLLLSGQWDPVTPPAFAERLHAQLPNSRHLVAPGQGHMVMVTRCMAQIAGQFMDGTALDALDDQCLQRLHPPRMFLNANGPAAGKEQSHD